jgi:hypothetical protein
LALNRSGISGTASDPRRRSKITRIAVASRTKHFLLESARTGLGTFYRSCKNLGRSSIEIPCLRIEGLAGLESSPVGFFRRTIQIRAELFSS